MGPQTAPIGTDVAAELREANQQLLLASLRERDLAAHASEAASRVTTLLQTMTEGATVFDGDGKIILVNDTGRRMLGCFLGKAPTLEDYQRCDLRTPEGERIDFADRFLARLLRGEHFSEQEVVLANASGERFFAFSGNAVRDERGRVTLAINVYRDITPLKHLEQMREQYLALVSHDLRGPLAAAELAAKLLDDERVDPELRRHLNSRLTANLGRIGQMIRDLLDAQQIRAGHGMPIQPAPCDLVSIAREVVESLRGPRGAVVLHGEASAIGNWSGEHLRRALWNLVSNAVKYGDGGEIELEVRKNDGLAVISVHNFGSLIPPEEQPLIFEPFFRSRAIRDGRRGWGLGLTLVRACAEAHGGTISVKSSVDAGTTFTLELPLDR
jgi:PAS domain S-box-containing protein